MLGLIHFPQLHFWVQKSHEGVYKKMESQRGRGRRKGASYCCITLQKFVLNDPSHIHNAFLRAPAATVTYSKYEQPVWFLAPLKRPFSFQAVIVCIPIQRLQSPTPIWPAALGNNVRFHHPCKHEFFFLSLSLSLFVPYGTGIKCTSEHFALYCTIKSYLPSELVSARTFQIILETHLSQKVA